MRFLLTYPIWPDDEQVGKFVYIKASKFSYGYASILGYFKKHAPQSIEVDFIDSEMLEEADLYEKIKNGNYDLIGLNSFIFSILRVYKMAWKIKSILPGCKIVVGGSHASEFPKRTLEDCSAIDYVVILEGEVPLLKLCEEMNKGNLDLSKVPNLFYRNEKSIIVANDTIPYLSSDQIAEADFAKFKMQDYNCASPIFKYLPTPNLVASRGCPFECSFCSQAGLLGRKTRYKQVGQVISEILYLKNKIGARGIWFQDSTFTIDKKWVYEFCIEMKRNKIKLPWGCLTRVDCVDKDLLMEMFEAGCWQIGYGLESGNQKTLDSMKKGTTVQENYDVVKMTKSAGIRAYASFVLGWPGESLNEVENTIIFAKKAMPHTAIFHIPTPYPMTSLFDLCVEEGSINEEVSFEEYQDGNGSTLNKLIYVNPKIGKEKMLKLVPYAYKRFYLSYCGLNHILTYHTLDQLKALGSKIMTFSKMNR